MEATTFFAPETDCFRYYFADMDFSPEILYNISHEISRKDEEQSGEEACVCDRHGAGEF